MTTKELSRRIFQEIYTMGRLELIEETHDEHCRLRDPSFDHIIEGPETIRGYVQALRTGFPDFKIEVERQIAEDDLVASQIICHGTHDGPFMGLQPTHNPGHTRCTVVQRFRNDKVIEADVVWDLLGFLNQLEVKPAQTLWENLMAVARGERKVEA